MRFSHSIDQNGVIIRFDAKPVPVVLAILKGNGFRWSPYGCHWTRRKVSGAADVICAIDKALNPPACSASTPCRKCGSPGMVRIYGAQTHVECNVCWPKSLAALTASFGQSSAHAEVDPMGVDAAYEDSCRSACGL